MAQETLPIGHGLSCLHGFGPKAEPVVRQIIFLMLLVWTALSYFDRVRHVPITMAYIIGIF